MQRRSSAGGRAPVLDVSRPRDQLRLRGVDMGVSELLPRVPQPPHDPRFLLLDRRTGWRAHDLQQTQVRFDGVLTLAAAPGASRSLLEPSGSFGGLVPPANVAVAADGAVYLLDAASLRLLRF